MIEVLEGRLGDFTVQKKPSLITLFLLMPFASVCAVLFTPALPEIARVLGVADAEVQSTMTLFLIGYALGSLPYGPIAKRFGRKPAIYIGVALAIFGSVLTLFAGGAKSLGMFLVGRFLTALGSAVGMKISFTIIADVFDREQSTKVLSLATLAFAIAPGVAVFIGGGLTTYFGWQGCFYALIFYSCLVFVLSWLLPETAPYLDEGALNIKEIKNSYQRKFKNGKVVSAALIMGCVTSIIYLFSTLAPFVAMNQMGLSPELYGSLNMIPPIGLIAGSFASHWLAARRDKVFVMLLGGKIAIAAILVMLFSFAIGKVDSWSLFFPMPFLYFGTSLIFNNASSFAMDHMKDKSNGSAIMSFINMMLAACVVLLVQAIASPMAIFMPLSFLCLAVALMVMCKKIL